MDKTYHNSFKNLFHKFFPKNVWTMFPFLFSTLLTLVVMLLYFYLAPAGIYKDGYNLLFNMPLYFSMMILPVNFIWLGVKVNYIRYHSYNNFTREDLFAMAGIISAIWALFSFAFIFIVAACLLNKHAFMLNSILYGQLVYAYLMFVLSTYALSILFAILIKSYKALGIFYGIATLFSVFVSGQIVPFSALGKNADILSYIALASPLNYAMALINNTLMISDYTSALIKNPDYLSTVGYKEVYLGWIGVNIFDFDYGFVIRANPPGVSLNDYLIYSIWNKAFNISIPWLVSTMGYLLANNFYYCMVLPKAIIRQYRTEPVAYNVQGAEENVNGNSKVVPIPYEALNQAQVGEEVQPEVMEQVGEEIAPAIETHPANTTWEEDGNYYYHDGQGNYYQADPTGTQWISIPPRV